MESHSALALPRTVVLALWSQALGPQGGEPVDPDGPGAALVRRAVAAVRLDDEPHTVEGDETASNLADLVARWTRSPFEVCAVLPAPGDPLGVPSVVSADATDAEECLLVQSPEGAWALVPEVTAFGSVYETGHLVTWHVATVPTWRTQVLAAVGTLADAERDLRVALLTATEALASLDVARWREDAAETIAALRSTTPPDWPLPAARSESDARRVRVLAQAARLRAIVDLATADDGGAVNLWQADQRSTALREVDRAARRAMSAATARYVTGPDPSTLR
ncbi:hypothetical protein [Oerskovia merdavium]|uniref:Uncharacterized protein n=1 Tax=Oerskovia merdavium TaxID=2762227 RepID=A0ABR8U161_9CELL|nr:hypothetical protein [Oerskovia merdavium]MBD7981756.1 hypothetical protein [Oerskovia merdavium]